MVDVEIVSNPIRKRDPQLARQFEQVVTDALAGHDDSADPGPLQVRFNVWHAERVCYVCKVECPSIRTLDMQEPPWRWWSSLVETPQELGEQLREAVRAHTALRRQGRRQPVPLAAQASERWGWAGELTLR